jgi:hypothetical protein
LITWILKNAWAWEGFMNAYNSNTWIFSRLNDWGVYLDEVWKQNLTIQDFKNNDISAKVLLDKWVDQIIDYENNGTPYRRWNSDVFWNIKNEIPNITDTIKEDTENVLNKSKYLPNDYNNVI